jgi:hypothetical protein
MIAQAATDTSARGFLDLFTSQVDFGRIDSAWAQLCLQHPAIAGLVLVPVGLAFLLYGYRVYKALVILVFALAGGLIGMVLGAYAGLGGTTSIIGMAGGALVLGLLAWPLHRVGWGVLGGIAFAFVFAGFADSAGVRGQEYMYLIAGGSFVLGLALTIWLFRPLLVVITSLVGAMFLAVGVLRLTSLRASFGERILEYLNANKYVLALAMLVLAGVGAIMQWRDTSGAAVAQRKERKAEAGASKG